MSKLENKFEFWKTRRRIGDGPKITLTAIILVNYLRWLNFELTKLSDLGKNSSLFSLSLDLSRGFRRDMNSVKLSKIPDLWRKTFCLCVRFLQKIFGPF